jgi:hypothetical protein
MSRLTDQQALDFLARLFPGGLGDPVLLAGVCPEGWENSPLRLAFHPGPERLYEEHCAFLKNWESLGWAKDRPTPIPTYEEYLATKEDGPPSLGGSLGEWTELLGECLWDVISDNHDVILEDGERVNFGSFRMVSALIDQFVEGRASSDDWDRCDYLRFYMGTSFVGGRTDLGPMYRLIFQRLQSLGCRWHYAFPRIYAIRFEKPEELGDYDPSRGFAAEQDRVKQMKEDRQLQERLDADVAKSKRQAWDEAPPATVLAYQEIFGEDPPGWPPDPESAD